jgi:hypothetical protein
MKSRIAIAAATATAALGLGAFASPGGLTPPPTTARAMVHCPAGNQGAFVTPSNLTIALGDSVEWRMTGQVVSDSLIITLKDPKQSWPFVGTPPRGGTSALAKAAKTKGTYGYSITLQCLIGGGSQRVVIDPDIIIN